MLPRIWLCVCHVTSVPGSAAAGPVSSVPLQAGPLPRLLGPKRLGPLQRAGQKPGDARWDSASSLRPVWLVQSLRLFSLPPPPPPPMSRSSIHEVLNDREQNVVVTSCRAAFYCQLCHRGAPVHIQSYWLLSSTNQHPQQFLYSYTHNVCLTGDLRHRRK